MPPTSRFDPNLLGQHFDDHGAEFGAATEAEYEERASLFWEASLTPNSHVCADHLGDLLKFDANTSEFIAVSPMVVIRSYYILRPGRTRTALQRFQDKCNR